jgi:hypothetical protein
LELYVYLISSWVTGRNFSTAIKLSFLEPWNLPVLSSVFWKLKAMTVLRSIRQATDHVLHVERIYRCLALLTIKYETLAGKHQNGCSCVSRSAHVTGPRATEAHLNLWALFFDTRFNTGSKFKTQDTNLCKRTAHAREHSISVYSITFGKGTYCWFLNKLKTKLNSLV